MRTDVSNLLRNMSKDDIEEFISATLQTCPDNSTLKQEFTANKDVFINNYSNLILRSCQIKDMDCYQCIWGGNQIYPILSVAIGSGSDIRDAREDIFTSTELPKIILEIAER